LIPLKIDPINHGNLNRPRFKNEETGEGRFEKRFNEAEKD
jgi:hypothetical protein